MYPYIPVCWSAIFNINTAEIRNKGWELRIRNTYFHETLFEYTLKAYNIQLRIRRGLFILNPFQNGDFHCHVPRWQQLTLFNLKRLPVCCY